MDWGVVARSIGVICAGLGVISASIGLGIVIGAAIGVNAYKASFERTRKHLNGSVRRNHD